HPVEIGAGRAGRPLQVGERLVLDRHHGDVMAEAPRSLEDEKREPAVAGNESEPAHATAHRGRRGIGVMGYDQSSSPSWFRVQVQGLNPEPEPRTSLWYK